MTWAYSLRHKLVSVSDSNFYPHHARVSKGMECIAGGGTMSLAGRHWTRVSEPRQPATRRTSASLSFNRKADSRGSINCNFTDRSVP